MSRSTWKLLQGKKTSIVKTSLVVWLNGQTFSHKLQTQLKNKHCPHKINHTHASRYFIWSCDTTLEEAAGKWVVRFLNLLNSLSAHNFTELLTSYKQRVHNLLKLLLKLKALLTTMSVLCKLMIYCIQIYCICKEIFLHIVTYHMSAQNTFILTVWIISINFTICKVKSLATYPLWLVGDARAILNKLYTVPVYRLSQAKINGIINSHTTTFVFTV